MSTPESMPLCQEQAIKDKIAALKAQLPPLVHEPSEPLHAVISKVFSDGATHTRTGDIANDWKRVGNSIRDAVKQGGEVVLRPLYAGEVPQEAKEYPSTKRIKALEGALGQALELLRELPHSGGIVGLAVIEACQDVLDAGKAGGA